MNSRLTNFTLAFAMLGAIVGCAKKADGAKPDKQHSSARNEPPREREWRIDRPPPTTTQTASTPLPVPAEPVLIKRGPAPLVYLVESPANLAVVDLSTNQRIAAAPAGARTIVRVEARTGVLFGEQSIAPGPLPADHEYGIYVEPGGVSEIRNETVAPVPREPRQQQQQQQRQQSPQTQPRSE